MSESDELDDILADYHASSAKQTHPKLERLAELLRSHGCRLAMAPCGIATYSVNRCGVIVAMAGRTYDPAKITH